MPQRGEVALFTARVVDIDSIPPTVDRSISLSLHAEWAGELWSVQQQQQAWRRMEVRHRIVEKVNDLPMIASYPQFQRTKLNCRN